MVETDPRPPPYNAELPREFCLEYWIGNQEIFNVKQKWVLFEFDTLLTAVFLSLQRYPLLSYARQYWRVHLELPLREFLYTKCFSKLRGTKFDPNAKVDEPPVCSVIAGNETDIEVLVRIDVGTDGTEMWKVLSPVLYYF